MTRRICRALDLADDPAALAQYDARHLPGGPPRQVLENLRAAGVREMEIHRVANRLLMVMDVDDGFDPARLDEGSADNLEVRAWAAEMGALQRAIPGADAQGWAEMRCVFRLSDQPSVR